MLLVSLAFAVGAGAPDTGQVILSQLLFIVPIVAIFYFLLIRPQQKRQKAHRLMLEGLKRGDTVITSGGLIGKIVKLEDAEVTLDAGEGVKLRVLRGMILEVRAKGEPIAANDVKAG
jgi:preprotein translocase subunit YajC